MGILIGILFLIISAVIAATEGDWSGIQLIIEVVLGIGMFFGMGLLLISC